MPGLIGALALIDQVQRRSGALRGALLSCIHRSGSMWVIPFTWASVKDHAHDATF